MTRRPPTPADPVRTLVTGVGHPLGQNVYKALKMSRLPLRIWVMEANRFSVGMLWEEDRVLAPPARSENYASEFAAFLERERIEIVFFGTEAEPAVIRERFSDMTARFGTVFAISPADVLRIADDKYTTSVALAEAGLDHPASAPAEDGHAVRTVIERVGFPVIAKPRKGSASRGLLVIRDQDALDRGLPPGYVVQEYLRPDDQEYTVGVYRCLDGRIATATVIRRHLDFGLTYKGVLVTDPGIETYAVKVVEALGAFGPINVQLRRTDRGPVAFEVNPRLSSTTPIRAHFGVNEPEMAIRELVLGERIPTQKARRGAVLRYWSEQYLEVDEHDRLVAQDLSAWRGMA